MEYSGQIDYDVIDFMYFKHEPKGYIQDRPKGTEDFLFLHFINPIDVKVGGQIIRTAPNACLIYAPRTPHFYVAVTHELLHNWLHFKPLNDNANPIYMGLPVNKIFYTERGNRITSFLEEIQWWRNHDNKTRMSGELSKMFMLLKEEYHLHSKTMHQTAGVTLFEELRTLVYQSPKNWDIVAMAKYVHLSRSHFSVKYKSLFGVSPIEDLGEATMRMAKRLITTTAQSIQSIALDCGYESVSYFIRKFKSETGLTPKAYREEYSENQ